MLIAGDTHGCHRWIGELARLAAVSGCQRILQLGDFGYWPHWHDFDEFRAAVDDHLRAVDVELWWIDGNHENHTALAQLRPLGTMRSVPTTDRTHWIPRGTRWEWGGLRFGALGGAASIDAHLRVEGLTWWSEEELTSEDVDLLGDGPLDVLLCHDSPEGVPLPLSREVSESVKTRCDRTRALLRRAVEATRPRLVLHGHWHHRHEFHLKLDAGGSTVVQGFADDGCGDRRSWAVLDLTSCSVLPAVGAP